MRVSCGEHVFAPQLFEQGRQRQSKDGEVVAVDPFEEMNAGSLQLVGAYAGGHGRARRVEVSIEKAYRKLAHGEPCDRHVPERDAAVPADADGGMQLMR